jgi:uncharacterized protein YifE (UPF0438 family)
MIVVRITGGLGNQMFQYAFARALQAQGKKVLLQWHGQRRQALHNGWELDDVFESPLSRKIRVANESPLLNTHAWLMRKTVRKREPNNIGYNPEFLETTKGYLDGYWQTEKYFSKMETTIRDDFRFKTLSGEMNLQLQERLLSETFVSVHVRRGDYLKIPRLGEVCTPDYYKRALEMMNRMHPGSTLMVFSDDIPYCRKMFSGLDAVYVDWNRGPNSWMDMALMSYCRFHIIANSSFSWWGAWLGSGKLTVAPKHWFSEQSTVKNTDIHPEGWILIQA